MANIMINEICNLSCPYCFASEFVNQNPKEMTLDEFKTALDFVLGDRTERQVGIIGGEPLLHPDINEMLKIAINDPRSNPAMIYTNAVDLERIDPEHLEDVKFRMLVNCNSPEDMGQGNFEKMRKNLRSFRRDHFGDGRYRLSVNIYKPDFDYSYVMDLVRELECDTIRLSISVPPKNTMGTENALSYFRRMKPVTLAFMRDMISCGAITGFDCNFMPDCVLTKEELDGLHSVKHILKSGLDLRYSKMFWERAILCSVQNCTPVIDILPDLMAIRCFGLSEYTKQNIRDYAGIDDLRKYYHKNVDCVACTVWTSPECEDCYKRENGMCGAGCYVFKSDKLFK